MNRMEIQNWHNKIVPDSSQPYCSRVIKNQYEMYNSTRHEETRTHREFVKESKRRGSFMGVVDGWAKFDLGTHWGVHNYQLVRVVEVSNA